MDLNTKYGARAARARNDAENFLPSLSSLWKEGDYFVMAYPATVIEGLRDLPVGSRYGHRLEVKKDGSFKRSWVPTTVTEFGEDLRPSGKDYLTTLAALSSSIKKGIRERKVAMEKANTPNDEALQVAIQQIDKGMKNIPPVVGRRQQQIVVEGLFAKLDANHELDDKKINFTHFQYGISNTKLSDLIALLDKSSVFDEEAGYFYVVMETDANKDKTEAGKADWKQPTKKLEDIHAGLREYLMAFFKRININKESIEARFYNFQPIDQGEVLSAVAAAIKPQIHNLKQIGTNEYFDFATDESVADALTMVELTADATAIKSILAEAEAANGTANVAGNLDAQLQADAGQPQGISLPDQSGQSQAQTLNLAQQAQTISQPTQPTQPTMPTQPSVPVNQ